MPDHGVLERLETHAHFVQRVEHARIAALRVRLVAKIGEDGLGFQFAGELGDFVLGFAETHNEIGADRMQTFPQLIQ